MNYKVSSASQCLNEQIGYQLEYPTVYPVRNDIDNSYKDDQELKVFYQGQNTFSGSVEQFITPFNEFSEKVFSIYAEAISSLKRTIEYNGVYIAYLLEQLSEEEFEDEASNYIFTPQMELTDDVLEKLNIFMKTIKDKFTPSELADIFQLDINVVDMALEKLNKRISEI